MRIYLDQDTYTSAKQRIRYLFEEFDDVVAWVSGGKDSTVIFNLALEIAKEKGKLPLKVAFIDQEGEWKHTITPCKVVNKLKGNTSIQLRRVFPDIRYLGYKQHFGKGFKALWARGYYCGSAGHVSQEQVKRYILEQQGKDVFEYDIFNCPKELKGQLKIGDFSA